MQITKIAHLALAILLVATSTSVYSQGRDNDRDQARDRDGYYAKDQDRDRDRARDKDGLGKKIYRYELMTEQERNLYRERMQAAKTKKERNSIRKQHKKDMRERRALKKGGNAAGYES